MGYGTLMVCAQKALHAVLDFVWWRKEGRQFSTVYLNLWTGLAGVSWMGREEGSVTVQFAVRICWTPGLASISMFRRQWMNVLHSV